MVQVSPGALPLPALGEAGPQLEEAATGSVELTRAVADFYNSVHVWDRADMTVGRAQQMLLSESAGAGGAVVLRSAPKAEGGTIQAFAVSYTHERTDAPADVLLGYDTALPAEEAEAAVRALLAMLVAQYPVQLEVDDSMTAVLAVLQPLLDSGLASSWARQLPSSATDRRTEGAVMKGVLFDVDGTLVDSNYLHVLAWWQAFPAGRRRRSDGCHPPLCRHGRRQADRGIARRGRDRSGDEQLKAAHGAVFSTYWPALRRFDGPGNWWSAPHGGPRRRAGILRRGSRAEGAAPGDRRRRVDHRRHQLGGR